MAEKIFITGTGRSGTTFLMRLLILLDYDTEFTKENFTKEKEGNKIIIHKNCNSGLESTHDTNNYILKSPFFIDQIEEIYNKYKIKKVIMPIRNFRDSALSRVKHRNESGGLWNAHDLNSQIEKYIYSFITYLHLMTTYDIDTLFLSFDKMVTSKKYLFEKLNFLLQEKNINFEKFSDAYDKASNLSKS